MREPGGQRHPADWGKMRRWFWQVMRAKILLPRRYRIAVFFTGFFLGAVIGTALGVDTLVGGGLGGIVCESGTEFWWRRRNRHRQMVARPSGANTSKLG